jgi:hypothetical protein
MNLIVLIIQALIRFMWLHVEYLINYIKLGCMHACKSFSVTCIDIEDRCGYEGVFGCCNSA